MNFGGTSQRHTEDVKAKIGDAHRGKIVSPETCKKLSESKKAKNRRWTDEHKQKISIALTGEGNPFYGKHHTEETKEILRERKTKLNAIQKDEIAILLREGNLTQVQIASIYGCCKELIIKINIEIGNHRKRITKDEKQEIIKLCESGFSNKDIALRIGCHTTTIQRLLKSHKHKRNDIA